MCARLGGCFQPVLCHRGKQLIIPHALLLIKAAGRAIHQDSTTTRSMSDRRSSRRSENQLRKSSSAKEKVLERLKNYRKTGEKVDYAGGEEEDVYDYVDEDEYAQIVQVITSGPPSPLV